MKSGRRPVVFLLYVLKFDTNIVLFRRSVYFCPAQDFYRKFLIRTKMTNNLRPIYYLHSHSPYPAVPPLMFSTQ